MSDGDGCSSGCGWCGMCDRGPAANASCSDCGDPFWKGRDDVGSLCDGCCDARDAHTDALAIRMAAVVDVAIVPADPGAPRGPVLEIALVPVDDFLTFEGPDAAALKRMAKAILAADLTQIREIA